MQYYKTTWCTKKTQKRQALYMFITGTIPNPALSYTKENSTCVSDAASSQSCVVK
jgi:hypothetical protein